MVKIGVVITKLKLGYHFFGAPSTDDCCMFKGLVNNIRDLFID